ncbi:MAG TPA: GntR family transcriptional regulator [Candidatus Eisenbacteria bacterium]|nr:GntR family transcriptional regulator [Candidatus Eisenbacteria bacterium]
MKRAATAPAYSVRSAIARAPLRSEVRKLLLEEILRGDLAPAAGITEAELSARIGVSRTPLREALLSLEREGFLTATPGRGFSVRPLTRADAEEIYPLLWTLEQLALRLAWPIARPRQVELEQANRRLESARRDPMIALARDREWHSLLLADCKNRRLLASIANLKDQAARYEDAFMRHSGQIITSVDQHRHILTAARRNDLDAALRLLEENWRVSLEFLGPWLDRQEAR